MNKSTIHVFYLVCPSVRLLLLLLLLLSIVKANLKVAAAQEHYGKVVKTVVTQQTNYRLGKKNLAGKYTTSYIQQAMQVLLHRKKLNMEVQVRKSEYSRKKDKEAKQRREARRQAREAGSAIPANKAKVEKQAGWGGCHTPMTEKK